mmetsp:Transcript_68036/g.127059  ORF Transcript_68036/g.127059 Transcript_68036/m.127059 type:complete len:382 (+) Transcript_68036:38-1183(+)
MPPHGAALQRGAEERRRVGLRMRLQQRGRAALGTSSTAENADSAAGLNIDDTHDALDTSSSTRTEATRRSGSGASRATTPIPRARAAAETHRTDQEETGDGGKESDARSTAETEATQRRGRAGFCSRVMRRCQAGSRCLPTLSFSMMGGLCSGLWLCHSFPIVLGIAAGYGLREVLARPLLQNSCITALQRWLVRVLTGMRTSVLLVLLYSAARWLWMHGGMKGRSEQPTEHQKLTQTLRDFIFSFGAQWWRLLTGLVVPVIVGCLMQALGRWRKLQRHLHRVRVQEVQVDKRAARLEAERAELELKTQEVLRMEQELARRSAELAGICKICMQEESSCALLPCAHHCCCRGCAERVLAAAAPRCPICRREVEGKLDTFPG